MARENHAPANVVYCDNGKHYLWRLLPCHARVGREPNDNADNIKFPSTFSTSDNSGNNVDSAVNPNVDCSRAFLNNIPTSAHFNSSASSDNFITVNDNSEAIGD